MKRKIGLILIIAGALMLLTPVLMSLEGAYYQYKLKRQWEQAVDRYRAVETRKAPVGEPSAPAKEKPPKTLSHPVARYTPGERFPMTQIAIPSIGLDAIVVEGVSMGALSRGPGHFPGTALPGAQGNCCIAGHRNMYGSWFRRLNDVSGGDLITLSVPGAEFDYRVTRTFKVLPQDVDVLAQTPGPTLTLVTCTPVPHPTHRLIVTAGLWRQRP